MQTKESRKINKRKRRRREEILNNNSYSQLEKDVRCAFLLGGNGARHRLNELLQLSQSREDKTAIETALLVLGCML